MAKPNQRTTADLLREHLTLIVRESPLDAAEAEVLSARFATMDEGELTDLLLAMSGQKPPSFEELAAEYATRGLVVEAPKGDWKPGKTMVCCPHDGVPYCVDAHPTQNETPDWDYGIKHRAMMIERHHAMIRAVWEHCQTALGDDVWVLCGGGCQLQAFFGGKNGYLGILYLDLESREEQKRLSGNGHLAAVGNESYTLVVESTSELGVFTTMAVPGVTVRAFGA